MGQSIESAKWIGAPILSQASQDLVIASAKERADYVHFAERLYEISPALERNADSIFREALNSLAYSEERKPWGQRSPGQIADCIIERFPNAVNLPVAELAGYIESRDDDCWREITVLRTLINLKYELAIFPSDPDYLESTRRLLGSADEDLITLGESLDEGFRKHVYHLGRRII